MFDKNNSFNQYSQNAFGSVYSELGFSDSSYNGANASELFSAPFSVSYSEPVYGADFCVSSSEEGASSNLDEKITCGAIFKNLIEPSDKRGNLFSTNTNNSSAESTHLPEANNIGNPDISAIRSDAVMGTIEKCLDPSNGENGEMCIPSVDTIRESSEEVEASANICHPVDGFDGFDGQIAPSLSDYPSETPNVISDFNDSEESYTNANFSAVPVIHYISYGKDGKPRAGKGSSLCKITMNDSDESAEVIIPDSDISKLTNIVKDVLPMAHEDANVKNAKLILENKYRDDLPSANRCSVYSEPGWTKIKDKMIYVHDGVELGGCKIETGLSLPFANYDREKLSNIFRFALSLYSDSKVAFPLVISSFLGVLFKLFCIAGYRISFTIFLNGRSGSMKTTIAKILFTQLCEDRFRENPRKINDTVTSIEQGFVNDGVDTTTLFDDYKPPVSSKDKSNADNSLEEIIRLVSDGSSKSRSNSVLANIRGNGAQGIAVITGEMRAKGLSTNLRCFYTFLEKDCADKETISKFQENPDWYTSLIQYFTYFVSDNWDRIIHLIKESYPVERKNASKHIDELRIIDSISTLCVSARILQVFLIERLNFSSSEADEFYNLAKKGIYHQAMMLYQAISNDDPDKWALSAIKQMIATRELRVVEGRPSLDELKQLDGYCDKNYVNFLPEKLFSAVKRMASSTGVFFSYNEDAFIKSLGEANIINSVKNGTGHRKYSSYLQIDNSKVKFVRIFKDKLEQ